MKNYFEKIKDIVADIYIKKLTDDQICNLAGYGLIKQLDGHSDLFILDQENNRMQYKEPLFCMMDHNILFIHMYDFSDKSLELFEEYIRDIDINKLKCILDLRRNVGGKLDCAIRFLKYFIPNKKIIDVKYRNHVESFKTESSSQAFYRTMVIINNETASASELVAGCIQYFKKGLLIGQRSCGKSSIQELIELDQNIILKLTVAYFYINGVYDINKKGLNPDIEFKEFKDIYSIKYIEELELGQVDYKIAVIQQCLSDLKLYNYQCNGIYDLNTRDALVNFNNKYNINSCKALSQKTFDAIKKVHFEYTYENLNAEVINEAKMMLIKKDNE